MQTAAIVETARRLFLAQGYGGTTMDDIARRCRISKRTLYRLFPSKTALFAAIVDVHRQSMLALPGDYDDLALPQALEKILRLDIEPQEDRERVALLRLVMVEAPRFPELREALRRHGGDRSRALLSDWLAGQRAAGRLEIDDTETAAKILMDMVFGAIALKSPDDLQWPSGEERRAHLRRCIAIFLNGVQPPARTHDSSGGPAFARDGAGCRHRGQ